MIPCQPAGMHAPPRPRCVGTRRRRGAAHGRRRRWTPWLAAPGLALMISLMSGAVAEVSGVAGREGVRESEWGFGWVAAVWPCSVLASDPHRSETGDPCLGLLKQDFVLRLRWAPMLSRRFPHEPSPLHHPSHSAVAIGPCCPCACKGARLQLPRLALPPLPGPATPWRLPLHIYVCGRAQQSAQAACSQPG